jgi:hypothetical protein
MVCLFLRAAHTFEILLPAESKHFIVVKLKGGVGKFLRRPLFLVFIGCGQLTGIQERSQTATWYMPLTRARVFNPFKKNGSASGSILAHRLYFWYVPVILL